ncbi:hypothetical protein [Aestuariimicrobium kwangyangense]|uniref:hypothetical protein n=1 Tax=Aestuariimicrobium kwangyangense TaxID=396389 RepID=UPI0004258851|nr:hypothetical protein [Aestuariimicrobium kwangyangense]
MGAAGVEVTGWEGVFEGGGELGGSGLIDVGLEGDRVADPVVVGEVVVPGEDGRLVDVDAMGPCDSGLNT